MSLKRKHLTVEEQNELILSIRNKESGSILREKYQIGKSTYYDYAKKASSESTMDSPLNHMNKKRKRYQKPRYLEVENLVLDKYRNFRSYG